MSKINKSSNLSYWETQSYLNNIDVIIIGSGIVGLNAAISYKEKNKTAKIIVLERGYFPSGASTKNAGFACFGSISELISDIKNTSQETVLETIDMRIKGLDILRKNLGDKLIDFKLQGGYELFDDESKFENCTAQINYFNDALVSLTKQKNTYSTQQHKIKKFGFNDVKGIIYNSQEGQIDTGKMMINLIKLAHKKGVIILNSIEVYNLIDNENEVILESNIGVIKSKKVIVATNGFANEILKLNDVKPARAQVLITKPILNLKIKGTFHFNEGYVYFRNIDNRILLGGGRNLDVETETTTDFNLNDTIQNYLDSFLQKVILSNQKVEIEQRWTGIMGVGNEKKPIIKTISKNIICAVRMGGMGVAIGSLVGKNAAQLLLTK